MQFYLLQLPHRASYWTTLFVALLVQYAVSTLSASDDVSLLKLVLMAAVPTDVGHALIGHELLLLLGWQHRTKNCWQMPLV